MVEFGDEFILESYKTIPWLIWIQLFITILLILLLFFGFAVFSPDPSSIFSAAAAAAPPPNGRNTASSIQPNNGIIKVEDQRAMTDVRSTQEDGDGGGGGDGGGEEGSSVKNSMYHPCNYIGLVKQAILKCLGLDSSSERSSDK